MMTVMGSELAVIYAPRYPYPPTSGGVKRTLRLVEAIAAAGAQAVVVTPDVAGVEAHAGCSGRQWHARAVATREPALLVRARQHARGLSGPYARDIARDLRRIASSAAFIQLEGPVGSVYATAAPAAPAVLSTQNVDSEIERAKAHELARLSGRRLRSAYRAWRMRRMERLAARRAEAVVCVSDDDAAVFEAFARRVVVAPNGVDEEFFASATEPPDNEDIVFFGQFTYEPNLQGIRRFLSGAWLALAARRPRARLLLAGEGGPELLPSTLPDRVEALGVVPDLPELLARSRVVLVPIWQGGGTRHKLLEGLAARRPVVGTPLGVSGIGFRDGVHGLVADAPPALAAAVERVLTDSELSTRLAHAGAELAEPYAWARTLAPAEALYRELIERRSALTRQA
jgi:glycosyltransferase involved in cell wall biosynthesis